MKIAVKRFWAFHYSRYYPDGGMGDLVGSADNLDDALDLIDKAQKRDETSLAEAHVWDMLEEQIVWRMNDEYFKSNGV